MISSRLIALDQMSAFSEHMWQTGLKMSFLLLQAMLMDVWIIVLSAYAKRRRK